MAHIRSIRYGRPANARPPRDREVPLAISRGYHAGAPDYRLPEGYTGYCVNLIPSAYGYGLTSRSGVSLQESYYDLYRTGAIAQVYDTSLVPMVLAVDSADPPRIHKLEQISPTWSTLSRLGGADMSHTSRSHVEIVQASASAGNRALVLNGTNPPKVVDISHNVVTWSDFTFHYSISSVAYTGTMADERLVLANLRSAGDIDKPYSLAWSVRGNPYSFDIALGAGFADLSDMNSSIQRLVPDTQGFAVLADAEIWRARPRRDIYAFDFIPITREIGCPFPGTAVASPFGTIFVGQDFEVYTLQGSTLKPLGPAQDTNGISRIRRKLRNYFETDPTFPWAVYDFVEQRYHLQVTPAKAFIYDFQTDSWWPQSYTYTFGWRGAMITDPPAVDNTSKDWDSTTILWDNMSILWNESGIVRPPLEESYLLTASTAGVPHIHKSWVTQDYNSDFSAHWRSPRISAEGRRYNYAGSWVEFSSKTASKLTVTTQYDDRAHIQTRSLQSSSLSIAWAPSHGVGRGVSVSLEFNAPDRVNFTGINALLRLHTGVGGAR